jgi:predicted transcriptional regulator
MSRLGRYINVMTQRIDILDDTARRLAQLQALTGQSAEAVIDSALRARLAEVETEALRAAVQRGADEADRGVFSERSIDEIFAQGIAQAKQNPPQHG